MQKSKYQLQIDDVFINQRCNIAINAVAGSGKTTTLLFLLEVARGSTIFMAFNKSIVDELKNRVPKSDLIEVATSHSIGFKSLSRFYKKSLKLNNSKVWKIGESINTSTWKLPKKKFISTMTWMSDLYNVYRVTLSRDINECLEHANLMGIDYKLDHLEKFAELIHHIGVYNKNPTEIDFTDMIYLPAILPVGLPTPDNLFIDEAQDLNAAQHKMVDKMRRRGRFVAVGDEYQCQPVGTKVRLCNGDIKDISNIKIGDYIVGYDATNTGGFRGLYDSDLYVNKYKDSCPEVLDIESRNFKGRLIKITTQLGNISKYTANHKCMVYLNPKRHGYCIYLMENIKGHIRIGKSTIKKSSLSPLGVVGRAVSECATKLWILKVFDDEKECLREEIRLSYLYSIPQLRFIDNSTGTLRQHHLDEIWNSLNQRKITVNSIRLLNKYNRDYNYPLWSGNHNELHWHFSERMMSKVYACNLDEKVFYIPELDTTKKESGKGLKALKSSFELEYEYYRGKVYSLKVSQQEVYVADNILTHNSIYLFAGAHSQSFNLFKNKPNTKSLPLSVCYRCGTDIIKYAQRYNSDIEPFNGNPLGEVRWGTINEIRETEMVICRNLRPLIEVFFKLIDNHKRAFIKGKDIGKGLSKVLSQLKDDQSIKELVEYCQKLRLAMFGKLVEKGIDNPHTYPSYINLIEKLSVILKISLKFNSVKEIREFIEHIFSDNSKEDSVVLSTIHKAKGLEGDRVFFLDRQLIPSIYAKNEEQLKQEDNLYYVGVTRAKHSLIFISTNSTNNDDEYIKSFKA